MKDSLNIGSVPYGEPCAQVGSKNYSAISWKECNLFIEQIRRELGTEPEGARLFIKSNPHDFGTYLEVECEYDDTLEASIQYAFTVESDAPEEWDEESKRKLEEFKASLN